MLKDLKQRGIGEVEAIGVMMGLMDSVSDDETLANNWGKFRPMMEAVLGPEYLDLNISKQAEDLLLSGGLGVPFEANEVPKVAGG